MAPRPLLLALCLAVFLPASLAQLQLYTPYGCRLYGGRCQRDIDCGEDGLMRSNFGPALCRSRFFASYNGYCCSATRDLCRAYGGQCSSQCEAGQVAETRYHALCRRPTLSCCFPNRLASSQSSTITAAPTTPAPTTPAPTTPAPTTPAPTTAAPTTAAPTTAPTTTSTTTAAPPTKSSTSLTTAPALEDVTPQPAPGTSSRSCGQRTFTRFFGGFVPSAGEWPWMAAVHVGNPAEGSAVTCAAVLISQDTLLTYDTCVSSDNDAGAYYVTLGGRDTSTRDSEQVKQVAEVIRASNSTFDSSFDLGNSRLLAMVKLNGTVAPSSLVSPVCLARRGVQLRSGSRCYTAGYGSGDGAGVGPLRAASVRLLSRGQCQGSLDVLTGDTLGADLVCSAAPRFDNARPDCPQTGDLGGMLVCEDTENLWTLLGITAPKEPCDQDTMPNLYLNVNAYSQWISANL